MKIIITERQLKLIERVINNEVFCDKCNWNWSLDDGGNDPFICHKCGHDNEPKPEPNVFTYKTLKLSVKFDNRNRYFNQLEPLEYDPTIPSNKIKLLDINDNETYIVDKSEFKFGKDNFNQVNGKVTDEYFLKNFSNNSKSAPKIESYVIRLALEKTFKNNWVSNDTEFSPGIRGIYKIGDYLNPKTSEDWSILNYFDTKKEVKDMIYNELVKRNLPLDDLVDSISTLFKDKSFMNTLVNRQWQSIINGEIRERNFMEIMGKILNSTNVTTYLPGSKMDRWFGVDVTIDNINYQVKPLTKYETNKIFKKDNEGELQETNEYVITTYGMKSDYLTKKLLKKIVFFNDKEFLIFDNKNYTVPAHYSAIFKDEPEIYEIDKDGTTKKK
jgi:hypothetical protein